MAVSRTELLAQELHRFGMNEPAASALSSEVVSRHPLAHRIGFDKLKARVCESGLGDDDANHLTLALWGLERLWLGACFQDLVDGLRHAGVEHADAFPACMTARKLWGAAGEGQFESDLSDELLLRWIAASASLIGLGALLVHLGI